MTPQAESIERELVKVGRVGVLMGGLSAEREISLKSGEMIYSALRRAGVDAVRLIWDQNLEKTLASDDYDRIFIALHGRGGEDGQVQGLLSLKGVPYTGSGVLGSALSMDKIRSKQIWTACDIPTPEFYCLERARKQILPDIRNYPVMVKPSREGSSIGISKVNDQLQLQGAIDTAFEYDDCILIEQYIEGNEYTLSILEPDALPIIRLETPNEFYDYEAKYVSDSTKYHCPAGLSAEIEANCAELGLRAFRALGANGWGRVDFMLDAEQRPQFIEVNTVPGMTDHSLVPMAAAAAGITFEDLVVKILATSFSMKATPNVEVSL
ncbi:MAG: D-alanine--D-alanine ligase [Gammaproteobacteria bacterium]